MMRKCLAVGIILLFIGVSVAPSINQSVVKASTDDDLVEVTTQACGIRGYGDTTVKLTKEQYQNLEQYLVEFRARLNQTSTREEAVPIFKEAVVELDRYGLLPKGMSVQRVERLVIGEYLNKNLLNGQEKSIHTPVSERGRLHNRFCLIAGGATNCSIASPLLITNGLLGEWFFDFNIYRILPINLFGKIFFSCFWERLGVLRGSSGWEPSEGEISTFGGFGNFKINGDFLIGNIRTFCFPAFVPGYDYYYLGVRGFCGLQWYDTTSHNRHFLGWCLEVDVTSQRPF
jgi:hypothetical protein